MKIHETINFQLAQMCRGHRNLAAVMLAPLDLYPGQDLILVELWREEGMSQSLLAERVGVDVSTMTKALQRLERHGFIQRCQDATDTRMVRVFLTDAGRALEAPITTEWEQIESRTLAGLTEDEQTFLGALLKRVATNMRTGG